MASNEENPPWGLQGRTDHSAEIVRRAETLMLGYLTSNVGGGQGGVPLHKDGDLLVTASGTPDNQTHVAAGAGYINGQESAAQGYYYFRNAGTTDLTHDDRDATNDRWDLIVARLKDSDYSTATDAWDLYIEKGTAAASPVDPTVTADNYIVLTRAVITSDAGAGAAVITSGDLTDLRTGSLLRQTQPSCQLYLTADTAIADGVHTDVDWTAENWDNEDMHDLSSNKERIIFPTAGLYIVTVNIVWAVGSAVGRRIAVLYDQDLKKIGRSNFEAAPSVFSGNDVTQLVNAVANDTCKVGVEHGDGAPLSIQGTLTDGCRFSAARIGDNI